MNKFLIRKRKATGSSESRPNTAEFINSLVKLGWLVLIALLLLLNMGEIKRLFPNITGVKGPGFEVTFVEKEFNAYNQAKRNEYKLKETSIENQFFFSVFEQKMIIERALRLDSLSPRVLWIDDNPDNNIAERKILSALGFQFDLAVTNKGAAKLIESHYDGYSENSYDLILSDVGKDNESLNGVEFLQNQHVDIPYIFYTLSLKDTQRVPPGAFATARRPDYLIHYIFDAIERGGAPYPSQYQNHPR